MTEDETPLDAAGRVMAAAPEDEAARRRFHARLAEAELFVLLEEEARDDALRPRLFALEEGRFALAFDRDDRLAAFLDAPAPYAALSGRRLAMLLAGRGVGLALNPGVAPSEALLPPEALDWLAAVAAAGGQHAAEARPSAVGPPEGAPEALVAALAARIASFGGLVEAAWLARLAYAEGEGRLTLAVAGAAAADEPALAAALGEAARLSGAAEGLDVAFLAPGAAARAAFEREGRRFAPDRKPAATPVPPRPPGSDPDRPPRLR